MEGGCEGGRERGRGNPASQPAREQTRAGGIGCTGATESRIAAGRERVKGRTKKADLAGGAGGTLELNIGWAGASRE